MEPATFECRACNMAFSTPEQLANHKRHFCVDSNSDLAKQFSSSVVRSSESQYDHVREMLMQQAPLKTKENNSMEHAGVAKPSQDWALKQVEGLSQEQISEMASNTQSELDELIKQRDALFKKEEDAQRRMQEFERDLRKRGFDGVLEEEENLPSVMNEKIAR